MDEFHETDPMGQLVFHILVAVVDHQSHVLMVVVHDVVKRVVLFLDLDVILDMVQCILLVHVRLRHHYHLHVE